MRCGLHALNNALGGEVVFTPECMSLACDVVVDESLVPDDNGMLSDPQERHQHEHANGWYSSAVLSMALRRTLHFELGLGLQLRHNMNILRADHVVGAVVNVRNQHWLALKRVGGAIWLLDSLSLPAVLSDHEFEDLVRLHPHAYAIHRAGQHS